LPECQRRAKNIKAKEVDETRPREDQKIVETVAPFKAIIDEEKANGGCRSPWEEEGT